MKRKGISQISFEELLTYSTKGLKGRLKLLHKCEQSFELSDREESERKSNSNFIEFKDTAEWQTEYDRLKTILKDREHIPREET
jgi:hypothetical protein